jgi:opacity protein-like surface antigen
MPEENHVLGAIMSNFSVRTISVISCVIISLTRLEVTAANAAADSTPDNAQLFQMIKSLQAKVTVLEEQNARYRKQAEEARKEARPVRNSIAGTPSDRNDTTKQIAPATVAKRGQPDLYDASYLAAAGGRATGEPADGWSGIYFGASVGVGVGRATVTGQENYFESLPGDTPPSNVNAYSSATNAAPHFSTGAFGTFFMGMDSRVADRFVIGAQAEGTIGEFNFGSNGTKSYVGSDGAGPRTAGTVSLQQSIRSPWMVTGLLRGGWLVDQATLAYGIGGWTVAEFDVQPATYDLSFNNRFFINNTSYLANGPTVGVGVEHKLGKNWSIRAEYRYTHFLGRSVTQTNTSSGTNEASTDTAQTKYQSDLQSGQIGISYLIPVAQ